MNSILKGMFDTKEYHSDKKTVISVGSINLGDCFCSAGTAALKLKWKEPRIAQDTSQLQHKIKQQQLKAWVEKTGMASSGEAQRVCLIASRPTCVCVMPACVFFRCIWYWRLSSWSQQPLWPYSHLCEYTEYVFCVAVSVWAYPSFNCSFVSHSQPVRTFVQRNQAVYWAS